MQTALSGCIGVQCLSYVDDIVVFSKDIDEHYMKLEKLFDALRKVT